MTLIGEVYVADVLGKTVLDPLGEEIGTLRDIAVEVGSPFPRAAGRPDPSAGRQARASMRSPQGEIATLLYHSSSLLP